MTILLTILASLLGGGLLTLLGAYGYVRWRLRQVGAALASVPFTPRVAAADVGGGYATEDAASPPAPAPPKAKSACEGCASFGHAAGQRMLDAHPSFRAAAQWRQPWQMGRQRSRAFIDLEKRIYDHEKTNGSDSAVDLRAELAKTEEWLEAPDGLEKNMQITWADFGLCSKQRELRAKTDSCPKFWPREVS